MPNGPTTTVAEDPELTLDTQPHAATAVVTRPLAAFMELSPRVVLVAMPMGARLDLAGLQAMAALGAVPPPLALNQMPAEAGHTMLLLCRPHASLAPGRPLALVQGMRPAAEFDLATATELAELLPDPSPAAVLHLIRFIAQAAVGGLRARNDAELAATCCRLLQSAGPLVPPLLPLARCGQDLLLWAPPMGFPPGAIFVLGPTGVQTRPSRSRRAMLLGTDSVGSYLLDMGGNIARQLAPAAETTPPLAELPAELHRAGLAELALASGAEPRAASFLRAHASLALTQPQRVFADPQRPVGAGLELAVDDHGGGLFLRGWLRDPLGLVESAVLRSAYLEEALPPEQRHRYARPDLAKVFAPSPHGLGASQPGFIAWLPKASAPPQAQWTLRLQLATGELLEPTSPPGILPPHQARDALLTALPLNALTAPMLDQAFIPALGRIQAAFLAARRPPEVVRLGTPIANPAVSVVVPLYRNMRFIRFQLGHFARDPAMRETELIYVLDSPEQRPEVEHLLRALYALYRLPITLVVQAGNYGFASACNAGAAEARAPRLLMLNSDVIPSERGWLPTLAAALDADPAMFAVGPKLLTESDSVQHAGLYWERNGPLNEWFNNHYLKGAPRHFPALDQPRRVPGITGAAMLLDRARFEQVDGFSTHYVIGDYEDSDLCLKLRAQGGEIGYEPRAELYHFERQSIREHAVHDRNLATAHNRRIHQSRWDQAIDRLMARPEFMPVPPGSTG